MDFRNLAQVLCKSNKDAFLSTVPSLQPCFKTDHDYCGRGDAYHGLYAEVSVILFFYFQKLNSGHQPGIIHWAVRPFIQGVSLPPPSL